MKLTVTNIPHYPGEKDKTAIYENMEGDSWVDNDWDFLFESLKEYRNHLKLKASREDSLGKQLAVEAKIEKLNKLFQKYAVFIEIAEGGRYDM